jgi:hypothetical protein
LVGSCSTPYCAPVENSKSNTCIELGYSIFGTARYKLRMMGVSLDDDGPTHIKADNMSVIKNSSLPEPIMLKKSNSITYHYV